MLVDLRIIQKAYKRRKPAFGPALPGHTCHTPSESESELEAQPVAWARPRWKVQVKHLGGRVVN
jgi:hypothetical protein